MRMRYVVNRKYTKFEEILSNSFLCFTLSLSRISFCAKTTDKLYSMLQEHIEDAEILIECHEEALDRIFDGLEDKRGGAPKKRRSDAADNAHVAAPYKRCRLSHTNPIVQFERAINRAEQRGVYSSPATDALYKKVTDLRSQIGRAEDLCRRYKDFGSKITPKRTAKTFG